MVAKKLAQKIQIRFVRMIFPAMGLVFWACSPSFDKSVNLLGAWTEGDLSLFTNRPQKKEWFIGVVTLKNPPLLEGAAFEALSREQQEFEDYLAQNLPQVRIIYRYRHTFNGFAVAGPYSALETLRKRHYIADYISGSYFKPPVVKNKKVIMMDSSSPWKEANSVKHIGAEKAYEKGIKGHSIKVGIIDTGIDYTHVMLGGHEGTEFAQVKPDEPYAGFPNKKVVGGYDFVGSRFNPGGTRLADLLPQPDPNPIDEAGHGTHVAATVAGLEGPETYAGVAPEAELYALKVFSQSGTMDFVVIAALEWALDPNADGKRDDRLDVVNLSLGGIFGGTHNLYTEVIRRVVSKGQMLVVAAAGNSGPVDQIVGAPSTADEALSVGAIIDSSPHNWQTPGIAYQIAGQDKKTLKAQSAVFSAPLPSADQEVRAELIDVGFARPPLSEELEGKLKGRIALAKRGGNIPFFTKAKVAADAGAVAVLIVNTDEEVFRMGGGDGATLSIPVLMVPQSIGESLIQALARGERVEAFISDQYVHHQKDLIDTITDFSSKGPRPDDLTIKPEIVAPGYEVMSALMGSGDRGVMFSGTSMASPHVAGAMALLKQKFPNLLAEELKALLMNTALPIHRLQTRERELVSLQGAGRVQVDRALIAQGVVTPSALSLGLVDMEKQKVIRLRLNYRNLSTESQSVSVSLNTAKAGLSIQAKESLIGPQEKAQLVVDLHVDASKVSEGEELDGWIVIRQISHPQAPELKVPFLLIPRFVSAAKAESLEVKSSARDFYGASTDLILMNESKTHAAQVYLFNHLISDARKSYGEDVTPSVRGALSRSCDIQSVGYRLLEKKGRRLLQIAVKLYQPVTHWARCEIVALFDHNADEVIDQELGLVAVFNVPGLEKVDSNPLAILSALFDGEKMREARRSAEQAAQFFNGVVENYLPALVSYEKGEIFQYGSLAILQVEVDRLKTDSLGHLRMKVASQDYSGLPLVADEVLGLKSGEWLSLSLDPQDQSFTDLPEMMAIGPSSRETIALTKGRGKEDLMLVIPSNKHSRSYLYPDEQLLILQPKFLY